MVSLFIGVVMLAVAWLILVYMADAWFGTVFLLLRGKCPLCGVRFNPPSFIGIGSIHTDYSLPDFCGSCGGRF